MEKQKVILDVDTGTDDAVAIMLAALSKDLDLLLCKRQPGSGIHHRELPAGR